MIDTASFIVALTLLGSLSSHEKIAVLLSVLQAQFSSPSVANARDFLTLAVSICSPDTPDPEASVASALEAADRVEWLHSNVVVEASVDTREKIGDATRDSLSKVKDSPQMGSIVGTFVQDCDEEDVVLQAKLLKATFEGGLASAEAHASELSAEALRVAAKALEGSSLKSMIVEMRPISAEEFVMLARSVKPLEEYFRN